jgi:hypothetical protein
MTERDKKEYEKKVDFLKRTKEAGRPLNYMVNLLSGNPIGRSIDSIKELDIAFASAFEIVELIPYLMKLRYRRTILDTLYKDETGKEEMINAAYVKFLDNPGDYATYLVPDTKKSPSLSHGHMSGNVGELIYTFDEINKYKQENPYELKDIPVKDTYHEKWEKILKAELTVPQVTRIYTIMGENSVDLTDLRNAVSSCERNKQPEIDELRTLLEKRKTGGGRRSRIRSRKFKKSKSKSKTKPKLKSKFKTKYRKQNK